MASNEKAKNAINPAHYTQGKVQCIDAIEAATCGLTGVEGFLVGNIVKYLWRWKHKNGMQDLQKAEWYLQRLIRQVGHDQRPR